MCLILFAYRVHPAYRLVLLANRDEFYGRPTAPAAFWEEEAGLLAGRDLEGGGTWLGVTRTGRFAAVTNYREPGRHRPDAPSRGALVTDFLRGQTDPMAYLAWTNDGADRYNGFNLLVGDGEALGYLSNRGAGPQALAPGLYGLSNHLLDTPWPKVERGKAALRDALDAAVLDPATLLGLLADTAFAPDDALPDTGVGRELERLLSPLFIESPDYGTRASTVLLIEEAGEVAFVERSHTRGEAPRLASFRFRIEAEAPHAS